MWTRLVAWLLTAGAVLAAASPAINEPQRPGAAAPVPRLVAIGDLHGDLDVTRRAFRLAGGTDARDAWIGGSLVIVQMGDLIGRGHEDRAVLEFVFDLQARAKAAGGAVHVIIGNHEVFAARPDHRWVDPRAFAAFRDVPGLNLAHPRLADVPADERPRAAALMPGGPYARRLAEFPAVLRVGSTIFAHGGVLPLWARHGIDRINGEVSAWLAGRTSEPASALGLDDGSADDGVMWSRHFAASPESAACPPALQSLTMLGARRMVVAHTVRPAIESRCDGRIWSIDVGLSRYYGGTLQVLEILNDQTVSVIPRS
jgi:hypothetical protein